MALLASLASTLPDTAVAQARERSREVAHGETAYSRRMTACLPPRANETWE
jgi:hypothetical protein